MSLRPIVRVVAFLSIGLAMPAWNPSKGDEPEAPDPFVSARNRMVQRHLVERGIKDKRVLEAFRTVPRHRFLPPDTRRQAYDDESIPIGQGQTITAPFDVAFMTEVL